MGEPKRCAIYARVSTDEQTAEHQLRDLREYVRTRGWTGQEFIELYNRSGTNVNLNGWHFNHGVTFSFTNINLAPSAYIVIAANLGDFAAAHPGGSKALQPPWRPHSETYRRAAHSPSRVFGAASKRRSRQSS